MTQPRTQPQRLPELHLADWRATKDTLHLYSQILGKIRLATTAPRNHWWNVPLYVDVRGLTTRRLHRHHTTFEITIDFVDHALLVRTADGRTRSFELGSGLPVADFDARLHQELAELGIDVAIKEEPFGVPMTTPFATRRRARVVGSRGHRRDSAASWTGRTRCSRSSADGSTARPAPCTCSGTASTSRSPASPAARRRGPTPLRVTQEAYTHEVISFGFWPGDDNLGDAAYYSYTAPEPAGLRDQPLSAGEWIKSGQGSLAVLPYETVRTARTPRTTLLAFCQSAYEAGARLAGWDTTSFTSTWCPTPDQIRQLHANAGADLGRTGMSSP